jgi:hypothetical protein
MPSRAAENDSTPEALEPQWFQGFSMPILRLRFQ